MATRPFSAALSTKELWSRSAHTPIKEIIKDRDISLTISPSSCANRNSIAIDLIVIKDRCCHRTGALCLQVLTSWQPWHISPNNISSFMTESFNKSFQWGSNICPGPSCFELDQYREDCVSIVRDSSYWLQFISTFWHDLSLSFQELIPVTLSKKKIIIGRLHVYGTWPSPTLSSRRNQNCSTKDETEIECWCISMQTRYDDGTPTSEVVMSFEKKPH